MSTVEDAEATEALGPIVVDASPVNAGDDDRHHDAQAPDDGDDDRHHDDAQAPDDGDDDRHHDAEAPDPVETIDVSDNHDDDDADADDDDDIDDDDIVSFVKDAVEAAVKRRRGGDGDGDGDGGGPKRRRGGI